MSYKLKKEISDDFVRSIECLTAELMKQHSEKEKFKYQQPLRLE